MAMLILRSALLASLARIIVGSKVGNLTEDLRPLLSDGTQIYFPSSDGYAEATTRWSASIKPGLDVVVKVTSEEDVQQTVSQSLAFGRLGYLYDLD